MNATSAWSAPWKSAADGPEALTVKAVPAGREALAAGVVLVVPAAPAAREVPAALVGPVAREVLVDAAPAAQAALAALAGRWALA